VKKSDSKKWAFFENGPPLAPARELTQRGGTQASAHAATPRRTRIETRREAARATENTPRERRQTSLQKTALHAAKGGLQHRKRRQTENRDL